MPFLGHWIIGGNVNQADVVQLTGGMFMNHPASVAASMAIWSAFGQSRVAIGFLQNTLSRAESAVITRGEVPWVV